MLTFLRRGVVFVAGAMALPVGSSPHVKPLAGPMQDPRIYSLRQFFRGRQAGSYSQAFVEAADRYSLDWRLLPSLAIVESGGGTAAVGNNFFGWDSGKAKFSNPAAAIRTVARYLAQSDLYRNKSLDAQLATYNPHPGYASKVKSVMQRISGSRWAVTSLTQGPHSQVQASKYQ